MQTIQLTKLTLTDGYMTLDLGCGEGRHTQAMYFDKKCHVIALDLSLNNMKTTQQKIGRHPFNDNQHLFCPVVGDALHLPFEDDVFDRIICSEVLEHIPNYSGVLDEIERIIKFNGQIGISVPRYWPEKICWLLSEDYHNEPGGHIRIFNTNQLITEIEARGFRLLKKHWAHGLHSPYWWLRCFFGIKKKPNFIIQQYHKLLVWEMMKNPRSLRLFSKLADIIMGKSIVLYLEKITK